MASIPQPRSYSQILGGMIDALLSRIGLPSIQVGAPTLSILEAAAQSDLRSSQDIFNILNSLSLDRATGIGLDRIGESDGVSRIGQAPSSGTLTFTDTNFTKIQSRIFQGLGAPIVGSQTINVEDASLFPSSGNVYIGRGTTNVEGPLAYSSKVNNGNYWTLNLTVGTQKFHNLGETVVVAQGGNRTIPAGTVTQTPTGNIGGNVLFATSYSAIIPDGEVTVTGVIAVAQTPGIIGNVIANSITQFVTPPYNGLTVTNTTPFTNGVNTEDDQTYRERIRTIRNSRNKATPLAIQSGVVGITALDENKRVLSSSIIVNQNQPVTLYIDDGTGYEEKSEGIPYEVIVESAIGGEQYFQLANGRPVTKAFVATSLSAPFNLVDGCQLAVAVGGIRSTHVFSASTFANISNASAYDVVASINSDPNITWSARTLNNGTQVGIFAKSETNEDVQVQTADTAFVDANTYLGLPTGRIYTLQLYKNDRLLTKDGQLASLTSQPQGLWNSSAIVNGATLTISVDGINISTLATVNDIDFVNAGTSYISTSAGNSLAAWAAVWNYKLPGITCTVSGSSLVFTSNSGRSSRASVSITGGTLATAMFSPGTSQGANSDYSLDRNLGQIYTNVGLSAGDRLTAGSLNTQGFLESPAFQSLTIQAENTSVSGQSGAELWFVVDGNAQLVKTGIGPGTNFAITLTSSPSWGQRVRYTSTASVFTNTLKGDWLIVTDLAISNVVNRGAYRIAELDPSGFWVEIEQPSSWSATQSSTPLNLGGIRVVRTTTEPQRVFIPSGSNYTALSLVNTIQPYLAGAVATVYRTTKVRISTDTFGTGGDISLVAANQQGLAVGFPLSSAVVGNPPNLASVLSGHPQNGTPEFNVESVSSVTSQTVFNVAALNGINGGSVLVGLRALPDAGPTGRYSNFNHITTIDNISTLTVTTRLPTVEHWLPQDRIYSAHPYDITARDQLAATIDGDAVSKRYVMNMYRKVKPASATYGITNSFKDADNSNVSLAVAFGLSFSWQDFAVFMKARQIAQNILWRYYRHGAEGNQARVQYGYPQVPNAAVGVSYSSLTSNYTDITVTLPSGAARTGMQLRNSSNIGTFVSGPDTNSLYTYTDVFYLNTSAGSRTSNVTTLTFTLPGSATDHGLQVGNAIWFQSTNGNFTTGTKIISARTTTTISFTDAGSNVSVGGSVGTVSYDPAGIVSLSGSTVAAGDIFNVAAGTGLGAVQTVKLLTAANDNQTFASPTLIGSTGTVINWYAVNNASYLSWYPIASGSNTQTAIITAVNALGTVVSGVDLGGGTPITYATYEAPPNGLGANNGGLGPWYYLTDGLNFVRSNTNPPNTATDYSFTFKNAVTAGLATGSDWIDEDVRLVPITSQGIVNYLNSAAIGGLFSVSNIVVANRANNVQISTLTTGSTGSVEIDGGNSNSVKSALVGGATSISSSCVVSIQSSDADGLTGNSWVSLTNALPAPKNVITGSTALTSISPTGVVVLSGTPAWTWASTTGDSTNGRYDNRAWQVEQHGDFTAFTYAFGGSAPNFTGINEGDWVVISSATTPPSGSSQVNSLNKGQFRVVRINNTLGTFWVKNPNVTPEISAAKLEFYAYNSIMPGDSFIINTTLWNIGNVGTWTVQSIDTTNTFQFTLNTTSRVPVSAGPVAALGSNSNLVRVYEGTPSQLFKQVTAICTNSSNSNLADIKLSTNLGYANVGSAYGTVLTALDKLAFGINTSTGVSQPLTVGTDGYRHSTGLIEEANRVVYGDETDTSTYPGIAAAGASININGPIVHRIQISLALRVKTGISTTDIEDQVQSAVAATVNQTPVGTSVAFSDVVSAAQSVNGVVAVTVLSPTYGIGNDVIPIQANEKPLVLNIDQDILISFVGE